MTKRVNYSSGGYSAAGGSTGDKGALFHTAVRVGVSAAMLQGYTTAYLGRPVSQASVTNAVVMGAAVAVSERIATMIYHPSETQHKYKTGVSSWAASSSRTEVKCEAPAYQTTVLFHPYFHPKCTVQRSERTPNSLLFTPCAVRGG